MSHTAFQDRPDHPTAEILALIGIMTEKDTSQLRQANALRIQRARRGKELSLQESNRVLKGELLNYTSQLQEVGIRTRVSVQPPQYRNKQEFLREVETSDEEEELEREAAMLVTVSEVEGIKKGDRMGRGLNSSIETNVKKEREAPTTASTHKNYSL